MRLIFTSLILSLFALILHFCQNLVKILSQSNWRCWAALNTQLCHVIWLHHSKQRNWNEVIFVGVSLKWQLFLEKRGDFRCFYWQEIMQIRGVAVKYLIAANCERCQVEFWLVKVYLARKQFEVMFTWIECDVTKHLPLAMNRGKKCSQSKKKSVEIMSSI